MQVCQVSFILNGWEIHLAPCHLIVIGMLLIYLTERCTAACAHNILASQVHNSLFPISGDHVRKMAVNSAETATLSITQHSVDQLIENNT